MSDQDKPLIVWDLDDVLNNLMEAWLKYFSLTNPLARKFPYERLAQNPPYEILGISCGDYLSSLDYFRNSSAGLKLKPNQLILDWFREKGHRFRHLVLTSRPVKTVPHAAEWVYHYFGNWIRTFHFVPSLREGEYLPESDAEKSEFLYWLGKADAFVDDTPENIDAARRLGIPAFTYPQPWNDSKVSVTNLLEEISQTSTRQLMEATY